MRVKVSFLLTLLLVLSAGVAFAQIYQYRDKNGQMHFTDQLSEVPEDQRPEVLKEPEGPAEPEKVGEKETERDVSEMVEPSDFPDETGQAPDEEEIPIAEDLNEEKAALDETHARLMKRKKALKKEREFLKTPEQVREYRKKVTRLNKEIDTYKERNLAFQKKADAYNKSIREKGEE